MKALLAAIKRKDKDHLASLRTEAKGPHMAAENLQTEAGSLQAEVANQPTEAESQRMEEADQLTEAGSRRTEVADRPTEAGSRRTEVADRPTEAGSRRTEVADRPTEAGSRRTEVADRPTEAGSRRTEVADRPTEAGSRRTEVADRPTEAGKSTNGGGIPATVNQGKPTSGFIGHLASVINSAVKPTNALQVLQQAENTIGKQSPNQAASASKQGANGPNPTHKGGGSPGKGGASAAVLSGGVGPNQNNAIGTAPNGKRIVVVGGTTFTANSKTQFQLAPSETLTPGGTVIVHGTTVQPWLQTSLLL